VGKYMQNDDEYWMLKALALAKNAAELGEVPVGAVIVLDGKIIGKGWNQPITANDPTAHAEIVALRDAARAVSNYRLVGADMYVTLEPCSMCAGAIVHSRLRRLVFGAAEPKAGAVSSQQQFLEADFLNHKVEWVGGVLAQPCGDVISAFFKARREAKKAVKQKNVMNAP